MKNKRSKKQDARSQLDAEAIRRDLDSPHPASRAKAVHALCPCRLGWTAFEQNIEAVSKLKKDPSPVVRAAALHVFEDADEMDGDGLPTHPGEATNEMLRVKRASRFRKDEDDLAALRNAKAAGRKPRNR